MSRPDVAVIIGNYNYGRFLADAIDSALGQCGVMTEVIVVDDGSTDDSRDVVARYGDRIRAALKENGGMGSTYNAGFAVSRAGVIIFLDADDVLLPEAGRAAAHLLADSTVSKVHWPLWEVDRTLRRTGHVVPARELAEGDLRNAMIERGPDAYLSPPTSGNAWSRAFLERVLPLPEADFRRHADSYLFTLAPVYGAVRRLSEPHALYRVHGGNDYADKPLDERNRRNLAMYAHRCSHLARHLARLGVKHAAERWTNGNTAYQWMADLDRSVEELKVLVPEGRAFILADDGQWGGQVLTGRKTLPFTERDGKYWGPPGDDSAAIAEFERLRAAERPALFAVAQPSFWWLDQYPRLFANIRSKFSTVLENDRLIAFDISDRGHS